MHLNPYLFFDGDCAQAFRFYARVLGWRLEALMTYGESPDCRNVAPEHRDRIIHACLVGDQGVLMASDCPPDDYRPPAGMALSVTLEDAQAAGRVFDALAEGGRVTMPMAETFFADRFGVLTDRYGIDWMIGVLREEQGCRK